MLLVRHVQQRDIDYEDLTAVDHLVRDVLTDQADLFLRAPRMATIVSLGHAFPRWAVTLGVGGDGARRRRCPRRRVGGRPSRSRRRSASTGCRS